MEQESKLIPVDSFPQCYMDVSVLYGNYVLLRDLVKIFKKYKLVWWLDRGSLLGALRHNAFSNFDDDVDISTGYQMFYKVLPDLSIELEKAGYILKSGNAPVTRNNQKIAAYHRISFTLEKFKSVWKERFWNETDADIQKYMSEMKGPLPHGDIRMVEQLPDASSYQYLEDRGNVPFPKSVLFPLVKHPMLKMNIPMPREPLKYLQITYKTEDNPITHAMIWNPASSKPICHNELHVDILDADTLKKMNKYLKHTFGKLIRITTKKTLTKYKK